MLNVISVGKNLPEKKTPQNSHFAQCQNLENFLDIQYFDICKLLTLLKSHLNAKNMFKANQKGPDLMNNKE